MANVNEEVLRLTLDDASFRKGIQQITVSLEQLKKALNIKDVDNFDKLDKAVKKVKFDELSKSAEKMSNSVAKSSKSAAGNLDDMGKSGKKSIESIEKASDGVKLTGIKTSADSAAEAVKNSAKSANDSINSIGGNAKGLKSASAAAAELNRNVQNVKLNPLQRAMQALHDVGVRVKTAFSNLFSRFSLKEASSEVDGFRLKLDALSVVGMAAISRLTNAAINFGQKAFHTLTEGITDGFHEYETQLDAIQTIYANTSINGTNMTQITRALNDLNTYADKTIYNFTQMTHNIGMFTAAGVGLQDSVTAIKGIANWAAMCGSNAAQANTAMYQLSQSLATGALKLQDWNSVVNAGMGGKQLQEALLRTAVHLKKIDWKTATDYANDFRNSLQNGWATTEVVSETFKQLTMDVSDYKKAVSELVKEGYTQKEAETIVKLAQNSQEAATKVKTFTQLIDTLKEAVGSGWTDSWGIVLGDLDEAKDMYSGISDALGNMIAANAKQRNDFLRNNLASGYKQIVQSGIADTEVFTNSLTKFGNVALKSSGKTVDGLIKQYGSFEKSMHSGWVTADVLKKAVAETAKTVNGYSAAKRTELGITNDQVKAMNALNDGLQKGTISAEDFAKKMKGLSGRENIIAGFASLAKSLGEVFGTIGKAWKEVVKPLSNNSWLYDLTVKFKKFCDSLKPSKPVLDAIANATRALGHAFVALRAGVMLAFKAFGFLAHIVGDVLKVLGHSVMAIINAFANIGKAISKSTGFQQLVAIWSTSFSTFAKLLTSIKEVVINIIDGMTNGIVGMIDRIPSAFDKLSPSLAGASGGIQNAGNKITATFKSSVSKLPNIAQQYSEKTSQAFSGLHKAMQTVGSKLHAIGSSIAQSLGKIDFFEVFDRIMMYIKSGALVAVLVQMRKFIKGFKENISDLCDAMINKKVKGALNQIADTFDKFAKQFKIIAIASIAIAIKALADALVELANIPTDKLLPALGAMGTMTGILVGAIAGIGMLGDAASRLGATKFDIKAINKVAWGMLALSVSLAIMARGIAKLKGMDIKQMGVAFGGLCAVILTMSGAMVILGKIPSENLVVANKAIKSIALALIGMSAALILLSIALRIMRKMSLKEIGKGLLGLTGGLILMGVALAALSKIPSVKANIAGIAREFIALGVAMIPLSIAVKMLGSLDLASLGKGLGGLTAILIVLTSAISVISIIASKGGSFKGAAVTILAFAGAMYVLSKAVKQFADLSLGDMAQGLGGVAAMMIAVTASMWALSKLSAGNVLASSVGILAMAAALNLLMIPVRQFADMDLGSIAQGLGALALAMAGLCVFLKVIPKIPPTLPLALMGIALALGVLSHVIKSLGKMSFMALAKGFGAFAIALGLLYAAAVFIGPLSVSLLSLSAAMLAIGTASFLFGTGVAALATGIRILATMGSGAIKGFTLLIRAFLMVIPDIAKAIADAFVLTIKNLVGAIPELLDLLSKLLQAACKFIITNAPSLCEAVVVLLDSALKAVADHTESMADSIMRIIVGVLNAIANHAPELVTGIGRIISGILLAIANGIRKVKPGQIVAMTMTFGALAVAFHFLAKMKKDVVPALLVGGSILLLLTGIAGVFSLMSNVPADRAMANAAAINATLVTLSGVVLLLGHMKTNALNALVNIGVMSVLFGAMGGVFGLLTLLDTDKVMKMSLSLSAALLAMSGAMAICALVNPGGAISAIGALGTFLAGLAGIVAVAGGLAAIPGFNWLIDQGIDLIIKLGQGLGKMIGGFVGGIAAGAMDTLGPSLSNFGSNLSAFMTNLKPFIDGCKSLTPDMVGNIGNLTGAITQLTLVGAGNSFVSIFTGGKHFQDLGNGLVEFGTAMARFSQTLAGVNMVALTAGSTAAKMLGDILNNLPARGGLAQTILGSKDWNNLSQGLVAMGETLKSFAKVMVGVNVGVLLGSIPALVGFQQVLSNLPSRGGIAQAFTGSQDWNNLSQGLVAMGKALKEYGDAVDGCNVGAIAKSVGAAKGLNDILNNLPNSGGMVSWFTGGKDWGVISNGLAGLGKALKTYGDAVVGLKVDAIAKSEPSIKSLAHIQEALPNSGGIASWFGGGKDWGALSNNLGGLGTAIAGFAKSVASMGKGSTVAIDNSVMAIESLSRVLQKSVDIKFDGDAFIAASEKLGKASVKFFFASQGANNETVRQNSKIACQLIKDIAGLNNVKAPKIEGMNAAASEIGRALNNFNIVTIGEDYSGVGAAIAAAKTLITMFSGLRVPKKAVDLSPWKNASKDLVAMASNFSTINLNPDLVNSTSAAIKGVVGAINEIPRKMPDVNAFNEAITKLANAPFIKLSDSLTTYGSGIIDGLTRIQNGIVNGTAGLTTSITNLNNAFGNLNINTTIGSQFNSVGNNISSGSNKIVSQMNNLASFVYSFGGKFAAGVKAWGGPISGVLSGLARHIDGFRGQFHHEGNMLSRAIVNGARDSIKGLKDTVSNGVHSAANGIRGLSNSFHDVGVNLARGLINGMDSMARQVANTAWNMGHNAAVHVKKGAQVHSPSKFTRQVGRFIDEGLILGMKDNLSGITSTANMIGSKSVNEIKNAMSALNNITIDSLDINPVVTPVMDLSGFKEQAKLANSLLDTKMDLVPRPVALSSISTLPNNPQNGNALYGDLMPQQVVRNYTFNQTNNSPKALDRYTIYRDTRTQFEQFRQLEKLRSK